MPHTTCTIRRWEYQLVVTDDESVDEAMRRVDRSEIDAICRHLLGDLDLTRRRIPTPPRPTG